MSKPLYLVIAEEVESSPRYKQIIDEIVTEFKLTTGTERKVLSVAGLGLSTDEMTDKCGYKRNYFYTKLSHVLIKMNLPHRSALQALILQRLLSTEVSEHARLANVPVQL